jgi:hypothetical protein
VNDENPRIEIHREYVTDATFVPRLFRAYVALRLLRFSVLGSYALLVLFAVVLGVSVLAGGNTDALVPFIALVAILSVLTLLYVLVLIGIRRSISRGSPVGSRYAVGLGEEMIRVEGPLGSSEIRYAAFKDVAVRSGFVFLQQRANKEHSALPIELFPGTEIDRLRDSVARA